MSSQQQGMPLLRRIARMAPKSIRRNPRLRVCAKILYARGFYRLLGLRRWRLPMAEAGPQRIFVDVSSIAAKDHKTGIQRVTRNLYRALAQRGLLVPVCASIWKPGYFLAQAREDAWGLRFLPTEQTMSAAPGDLFFALDFAPAIVLSQLSSLRRMRKQGMELFFLLHDLIPLTHANCFPAGMSQTHAAWLAEIARLGQIICVSRAVREQTMSWLGVGGDSIHWFHHGFDKTDFNVNEPLERRMPPQMPYFLTVGTVEPRKGHAQILAAFEKLWAEGEEIALVFAGQAGWQVEELCARLRGHPMAGRRLFWFEHCGDGLLGKLYAGATCLLMASHAEGFGLPILEGAAFGKPLLLRDLPVFREIAGEHASYFSGSEPLELAAVLRSWLALFRKGEYLSPKGIHINSWQDAADRIYSILTNRRQQPGRPS